MTLPLTPSEARWIDHIRSNVVGRLEGTEAERARTAAIVAWWALKEGILDLPNPLRHNLCSAAGERQIGDLGVCPRGAWQIGLSGIQGGAVRLADVEAVAQRLYLNLSIPEVLERSAKDAGIQDPDTLAAIRESTGDLRKAWLLRDGAIGFTLQRPFVERGCLSGRYPWCFGSWDTARRFASDEARIREVISDLESQFRGVPREADRRGGLLGNALLVALVGGATYLAVRGAGAGSRRRSKT